MKKNDLVICKKTRKNGEKYIFIKDRKYKILNISYYNNVMIESEYSDIFAFNFNSDMQYYIYDYFYTKEELRKLKLNSL